MSELTYQTFAQPYTVDPAELQDLLTPARTTTQLADAGDTVNTKNKFLGKRCYNLTLKRDYIADGPAATDDWTLNDGVGSTQVTPS
jgi:hypothetical protein